MRTLIKIILIYTVCTFSAKGQSLPDIGLPQIAPPPPTMAAPKLDNGLKPPARPSVIPAGNFQQNQNRQIMDEVDKHEKLREDALREMQSDIAEMSTTVSYELPSLAGDARTSYYFKTLDRMNLVNPENYSLKDIVFSIENAYLEDRLSKKDFDKTIKETGDFLRAKMKELKYDANSNMAKNYILFRFFSENLKLKATGIEHKAFTYDFEDYMGIENYAKMFVTKLLRTGSGQCHSMPLLYLILAEEIGAEAHLSLSPNHSYIKFQDEKKKWYNLELTNGMFTTNSFILNSGFIKAEAMQNQIYMQSMTKKQLLSQLYTDLASGYCHKFGYDKFIASTINKALELYPNNINAQMLKANYDTYLFEHVMHTLGIDPRDSQQLQNIRHYPRAVS